MTKGERKPKQQKVSLLNKNQLGDSTFCLSNNFLVILIVPLSFGSVSRIIDVITITLNFYYEVCPDISALKQNRAPNLPAVGGISRFHVELVYSWVGLKLFHYSPKMCVSVYAFLCLAYALNSVGVGR